MKSAARALLLLSCILVAPALASDRKEDFLLPIFLENAWGLKPGDVRLYGGIELEEDSGDNPTTKFLTYLRWGLSERLMLTGSAMNVRFNQGTYTAWGPSNTALGLQYRWRHAAGKQPAMQLKGEILAPTGGLSTGHWNFAAGMDSSWQREKWGLHRKRL